MIGGLIDLIIYLLVAGVLIGLVFYVVDAIPIPDPLNRIIKLVVIVLACLIVILLLLSLLGVSGEGGLKVPRLVG